MDRIWYDLAGKTTRENTHELNNVFAIIKECAGLIQDHLSMDMNSESTFYKKMNNSVKTIENQISRGMEIAKNLNLLAHVIGLDRGKQENLYEIVRLAISLTQASWKKKGVNICIKSSGASSEFVNLDSVLLHTVIFLVLSVLLELSSSGSSIKAFLKEKDNYINLHLISNDRNLAPEVESVKLKLLEQSLVSLNGIMNIIKNPFSMVLAFPKKTF